MEDLGITSPSCFEQETDKVNQLYNDMREIDGKSSCRVVFQLSCSYYFFALNIILGLEIVVIGFHRSWVKLNIDLIVILLP